MPTIVDIHCHTFNGDDLPVKGFINRVGGTKSSLVKLIDDFVDNSVQGHAPGFHEELEEVAKRSLPVLEGLESPQVEPSLEDQAEEYLEALRGANPELVQAAQMELIDESGQPLEEGLFSFFGDVKRWIKWALLFTKHRVKLTEMMASTFSEVDLFTPMLVDMELGLGDPAQTRISEQLEMQDAISKVSMQGLLRGAPSTRVHPFVGFDPRRPDAVDIVRAAVEDHGCVGVKMYPPMGFRPLGNASDPLPKGMTANQAAAADRALRDLYTYCVDEQVPVTAHSNPTNYADDAYREFSSPGNWRKVLQEFETLRLNLGHFGGSGEGEHASWPGDISAMTAEFPNLYGDIGNHNLDRLDRYVEMLSRLFAANAQAQSRLMFGTDWFMLANHRDADDFLVRFRDKYDDEFPQADFPGALDGFMGGNALRFLGFDDPSNRNTQRLVKRYRDESAAIPDWLATI